MTLTYSGLTNKGLRSIKMVDLDRVCFCFHLSANCDLTVLKFASGEKFSVRLE